MPYTVSPLKTELSHRLDTVERLLESTAITAGHAGDISREGRGLVVVLLYAAYENLVTSLCRSVLEFVNQERIQNRSLYYGLQVFVAAPALQSVSNGGLSVMWKSRGSEVTELLQSRRRAAISSELFPTDGSKFRRAQLETVAQLCNLPMPGWILKEVWDSLDTVVIGRNAIAHGRMTPEEVGRSYTTDEMRSSVRFWRLRWMEYLDAVETRCSDGRAFRRT
jgi:hypothetical protein